MPTVRWCDMHPFIELDPATAAVQLHDPTDDAYWANHEEKGWSAKDPGRILREAKYLRARCYKLLTDAKIRLPYATQQHLLKAIVELDEAVHDAYSGLYLGG